jgi:hypothetical protein
MIGLRHTYRMLPMCPASMGSAVSTGMTLWAGALLVLVALAVSLGGLVGSVRRARRGGRSVGAALAASLMAGASVGFFLAVLPGSGAANFQLTDRLATLILFQAVCGLPLGWLLAAVHPFWSRRPPR